MKRFALTCAVAIAAAVATGGIARAGSNRHSCQKALQRAIEAIAAYSRASITAVKAEIGAGPMGTKHVMTCEIEPGDYKAFACGEKGVISGIDLGVADSSGKELTHGPGVDEALCQTNLSFEKKETLKVTLEVTDTVEQKGQVGGFVVALLTTKQPPEPRDFLFEAALKQVKEMEGEGYDVEYGLFDMLPKDKPWTIARKLGKNLYRIDGVGDDNKVKDLNAELKGPSGVIASDARKDNIASFKADVSVPGEHTLTVSATYSEGEKEAFSCILLGKLEH